MFLNVLGLSTTVCSRLSYCPQKFVQGCPRKHIFNSSQKNMEIASLKVYFKRPFALQTHVKDLNCHIFQEILFCTLAAITDLALTFVPVEAGQYLYNF